MSICVPKLIVHCKKKVQSSAFRVLGFQKKYYISNIKRNVMSSVVLNIHEEKTSKSCFCNDLIYSVVALSFSDKYKSGIKSKTILFNEIYNCTQLTAYPKCVVCCPLTL